ncbi:MAG: DUF5672 family protein [Pirellulaceae bacterium]
MTTTLSDLQQNSSSAAVSVAKKLVAIAVPTSSRPGFTADDETSLRHLTRYLGQYDKFLVRPRSVKFERPGFGEKVFDDNYFGSQLAHTRLMLSRTFYEAFQDYEYVLIYHLDALVFSDELESWCRQGYDYIGAPWLISADAPEMGFSGVGNGGFSLRRVSSILDVMHSRKRATEPSRYWQKHFANGAWYMRMINRPRWLLKHLPMFNNVHREMASYGVGEPFMGDDQFFAHRARHYLDSFAIPPAEVAVKFAFNSAPRYCYERNQNGLPFGCHAWGKYDRDFWEPFLLK